MHIINSGLGKMIRSDNDILYVLVICGCTVEDSIAFQTLIAPYADEIGNTFVYDNTPQIQTTKYKVAKYVSDTNNSGLSKAYNEACKFAIAHGYKWILLLDQDTWFPSNALKYYKTAAANTQNNMIVPRHQVSNGMYMSPTPYRMFSSDLRKQAPTGTVSFNECCPINSGMMLTVESFVNAGGYEETVWLDFSDICFIEKYRKYYHTFYVMPEVVCKQAFSALDNNSKKVYDRFCIYLECARNFARTRVGKALVLLITTLRPTISRTFKEQTWKYLKAYYNIYVLGKNLKYNGKRE